MTRPTQSLRWLLPLLLVAAAGSAQAQTTAEPRAISLVEAVRLAQQNALAMVQAQGQERTSDAAVRSAYASFLPSVTLSAGATRQLPAGARTRIENGQVVTLPSEPWSYSTGLGASVQLFDGGRRFFDVRQARARATAAEAGLLGTQFSVALDAKQQYFNVLAARESQVAAAAQLGQAEQQRKTSVALARAREATRSDSLRAEIQVRNAQLAVADAANALELANASLTRTVGAPYTVTADTTGAEALETGRLALGDAEVAALAENGPAVKESEQLLRAARASKSSSWTDYLPSLNMSYSRSGSGASEDFTLGSDLGYSGALRFSASFPLFNQLQREEQRTQASVAADNAEAALRDTRLAARENVVRWLGTYRLAAQRVEAQAATVAAAEEDLRVQRQRYAVGGSTLLDVLTSQTQLDQARRDLIQARYDQRVAKAQLEALVGRDL